MIKISSLNLLLTIAERAIAVDTTKIDHTDNMITLKTAYDKFRTDRGIPNRVGLDSPVWDEMKAATSKEFEAVEASRRSVYNAERRLQTAVRKYRSTDWTKAK